jgi:uncharacterized protein (TIGR00661 family)
MEHPKNILVAPLNWGLGHATRCIPIIRQLQNEGFTPIIASDGAALQLLKREFPELQCLELPSYHIEYAKNPKNFKWKLIKNSPKTIKSIREEKKIINQWITDFQLKGIISDNRLGANSKQVPSVIITHQLTVFSGKTTWISSYLHRLFIKKFDECWVPDWEGIVNLSGELGHPKTKIKNTRYIGPLSRLEKIDIPQEYDFTVLLSGPEPQRSLLEEKIRQEMQSYEGKIFLIRGVIEDQPIRYEPPFTIVNYLTSQAIANAIASCKMVICRSGYTTIMDLARLEKKAVFIPTPGQYEQVYLAKYFHKKGMVLMCNQKDLSIKKLKSAFFYQGLPVSITQQFPKNLFALFQRK